MSVRRVGFGGKASLFTLEAHGLRVAISDFGAALVSFWHPDGTDLVLGYDSVDGYLQDCQYMGVIVGRYANRLAHGRFRLGGHVWQLACNEGFNHLHGGENGFGRKQWKAEPGNDNTSLQLTYFSPHLDQGYPGDVTATATYQITKAGRLRVQLEAVSDQQTLVNLSSHGYFNLAGSGDVLGHDMKLKAGFYTPLDEAQIPSGEIISVAGTLFDYREKRRLNQVLDTNFVVDGQPGDLRPVAEISDPLSGRMLSVCATMPGVQVYVGGGYAEGGYSSRNAGFCIEPQYFPDSPNQPQFSAPVIDENNPYSETIEYSIA